MLKITQTRFNIKSDFFWHGHVRISGLRVDIKLKVFRRIMNRGCRLKPFTFFISFSKENTGHVIYRDIVCAILNTNQFNFSWTLRNHQSYYRSSRGGNTLLYQLLLRGFSLDRSGSHREFSQEYVTSPQAMSYLHGVEGHT